MASQAYLSRISLTLISQYLMVGYLSTLTLLGGPSIYSLMQPLCPCLGELQHKRAGLQQFSWGEMHLA